jgi:hypothetical protein
VSCVGLDHILGLLFDLEGITKQVENEREVEIAEIDKVLKLSLVDHPEIVIVLVAIEPRIVKRPSNCIAN